MCMYWLRDKSLVGTIRWSFPSLLHLQKRMDGGIYSRAQKAAAQWMMTIWVKLLGSHIRDKFPRYMYLISQDRTTNFGRLVLIFDSLCLEWPTHKRIKYSFCFTTKRNTDWCLSFFFITGRPHIDKVLDAQNITTRNKIEREARDCSHYVGGQKEIETVCVCVYRMGVLPNPTYKPVTQHAPFLSQEIDSLHCSDEMHWSNKAMTEFSTQPTTKVKAHRLTC